MQSFVCFSSSCVCRDFTAKRIQEHVIKRRKERIATDIRISVQLGEKLLVKLLSRQQHDKANGLFFNKADIDDPEGVLIQKLIFEGLFQRESLFAWTQEVKELH